MKPDISEFSYGFALTSEIIDEFPAIRHAGAPQFPSLYAEGQQGGGYDVHIPGLALFLQFKLSEVLTRANANEASLLGLPYLRMKLRALRHSAQHNLLIELENCSAGSVFYVAPEFHTPSELNSAYLSRVVAQKSAFFSPGDIGDLPDDKEHYVVFTAQGDEAYFCSRPQKIKLTRSRELLKLLETRLPRTSEPSRTISLDDFYENLKSRSGMGEIPRL